MVNPWDSSEFSGDGIEFPFSFYVEPTWKRPYRIEVRDGGGGLIRYLTKLSNAQTAKAINEPSRIEFDVDLSDPAAADLQCNNQIWLRGKDDAIVDKYSIRKRVASGGGGRRGRRP